MSIRVFKIKDETPPIVDLAVVFNEKISIEAKATAEGLKKITCYAPFIKSNPDQMSTELFEEVIIMTGAKKMAMFCRVYKERRGISYTPIKKDVKSLEEVPVTLELLKTYFDASEWWCKVKNVGNYVANINNINELHIKGKEVSKMVYPTQWEPEFAAKCTTKQLQEYWKVLGENGYVYKQGRWFKKSE
jgi:hypothetical protein